MAKQDVELKFSLIDGVSRNLAAIQQGVAGLGAQMVKLNASADLTGKAFGAIKTAGNFLSDQITSVGNFEDSLASLQAVTGASAEELGRLRDAAVAASQASIFSSTQAADGLTELARAGFSASESISALNPVLALAQGQQLQAGESTQFVTTTLTQFGLAAEEAGRVADVLASAADKSSLDVRQLGLSLSYAAPIAKQVGLTLEETTAIIGKLADEGFRGERGGTALANVFTALIDPSSKFSKALDDAGIKTRDFSEVMQALADKGDGATKILLELDTTARPAITALASKGSAGIRELTKALDDSTGAAQRTADILGATFNATVTKFENNITNLRNALLTPILAPLGDEIQVLSDRLIAFSKSPEFDVIVGNFTRIATEGLRILGDEIAKIDLTDALNKVIDFSTSFAEDMAVIAKAVDITARAIGGFFDIVSITYQSLKGVTADVAAAIIEPLAVFNGEAEGVWLSLKEQAADSEKSVGSSLDSLGRRFAGTSKSVEGLDGALRASALAAKVAAGDYKALSDALPKSSLDQTIERLGKLGLLLKETPKPTDDAAVSIEGLGTAARNTAIEIERIAIGNLLKRMDKLFRAGQAGSDAYKALNAQFLAAEARVNALTKANEDAAKSADDVAGATDRATQSVRNYGSAADDASRSADRASSSNSQVAESFGNIERQSSSVAISLGNLSETFVKQALEAAGAAGALDGYLQTLNQAFAVGQEIDQQVQARIDQLNRQNAALSEESALRRRLEAQGFGASTQLEELIQLELRLANAKKQTNDEAERGVQIEAQRRGQAGGIGTSRGSAQEAAPATTGGRGTAAGSGGRGEAPQIVINVQGMTNEQAREFVAQAVVPELERINRLSR